MPLLAGGVVSQDELWSCTTCGACEEACPVFVEPVKKIIELRRNLVLEQGEIPPTLMAALRSMQDRGHPWKGASASRTDWTEGFEVKNVANDGDAEFLFWVGCTAALQESSMKAALALARLLDAAGVKISILGHEESCCGHQARRIGDEYLFQCQAQAEHRDAEAPQREEDHHRLPALLPHAEGRVPAVRRRLRSRAPHGVPAEAGRRRAG